MRHPFVFVTGNTNKVKEAERILGGEVRSFAVDLPEVQSLDLFEILRAKAAAAYEGLGVPVVVEDVSFELHALNGFPGPLVKWMLEALGAEGLARVGINLGDPRARAICGLAYHDGNRIHIVEGRSDGTLVVPRRGEHGFGWDPVFQPDGSTFTYAELSPAEKDLLGHRGKAWRELLAILPP